MRIPVDKVVDSFRAGARARSEVDESVAVSVYVDSSATPFLIDVVRRALVPRTVNASVRVFALSQGLTAPRGDIDLALVISCGSDDLERTVHALVLSGTPCCVIAESSVEVPFDTVDSPMFGLIAATDERHLLDGLATWIVSHMDKRLAFASNFEFVRGRESDKITADAAVANAVTGALAFIPGSDFPVMTATQVAMMLKLAAAHGKSIGPDRAYEAAGIIALALVLRATARRAASRAGGLGFAVKALVGCGGTVAMGRALERLYCSGIDYGPVNTMIQKALHLATGAFAPHSGCRRPNVQ